MDFGRDLDYLNVSRLMGAMLTMDRGPSYRDLDEYMSIEDAHDVLEVAIVNAHNRRFEATREEHRARVRGKHR